MSSDCNITNLVTNSTSYSFTLLNSSLSSGNWVVSPQPIPANSGSFNAFQAVGVAGTATGAVGQATYNVLNSAGKNVGTFTFNFSDPYSGHNSCSPSTTVSGLSATNDCPSSGSTFNVDWTLSS
jgi:hypothetical protein